MVGVSEGKSMRRIIFGITIMVISLFTLANANTVAVVKENIDAVVIITTVPKDKKKNNTLGTGVFIDTNTILTSYHVVKGSKQITIELYDGRVVTATIIGYDRFADIALLSADVVSTNYVEISERQLVVGEEVVVIGHPRQFYFSVSSGIVSHTYRPKGQITNVQIDAAVNHGNSGGPVFDSDGKFIAIIQSIYSSTGDWSGIAFAYPGEGLNDSITRIKISSEKSVERPYVGFGFTYITHISQLPKHLYNKPGIYITDIIRGAPAHVAGLRAGDKIVSIGGKSPVGITDFNDILANSEPGAPLIYEIIRDKKKEEYTVVPDGVR